MVSSTVIHSGATVLGDAPSSFPLIICFHGSGDSCASWMPLAQSLSSSYLILLWDRGDRNAKPGPAVRDMLDHLRRARLPPPYVLVAHSYGGTFAREFLRLRPSDVAGMVLVETGQETALDPRVERAQYRGQVLGARPLSVIRGNTLIAKWAQYEAAVAAAAVESAALTAQGQFLEATDREDERLKKAQLALSRNHRYVHVPDCGHNVVQDRPDVVEAEVRWIMANLRPDGSGLGLARRISNLFARLRTK
jgi:pimeloyl-ACP methyl ester carboxylesterase